ncbi:MAG: hypothetical protein K8F29_12020 [Kofleriaceae bacterium]|nr:hypothetical protein [Candidatus Methylomirabilis lanthanidiphila]
MRRLGFDGPFVGWQYHFMVWGAERLAIPSNPEYSVPQLRVLIREVEAIIDCSVPLEEWQAL